MRGVHGGFAAVNRGADFIKHLAQCSQAALARTAHGAGQHSDYLQNKL